MGGGAGALVRRAEEYGFHTAWTYDHLGWRDLVDGPWFDAVPTLTAARDGDQPLIRLRHDGGQRRTSATRSAFAREVTAIDDVSRWAAGARASARAALVSTEQVLGAPALTPAAACRPVRQSSPRCSTCCCGSERVTWTISPGTPPSTRRRPPGCVQRPRAPFVVAANGPGALRAGGAAGPGLGDARVPKRRS